MGCDSQASYLGRYGQSEVTGGRYRNRQNQEEEEEQVEEPGEEEDGQEMETEMETTETRKRLFPFFLYISVVLWRHLTHSDVSEDSLKIKP